MSHTIAEVCRYEESIKRSRFVAHAGPVSNEADTLAFYESIADPSASHNCWAWRLGLRYRFNDDGEPGGSAGRPILAILEGRDLDGVMVVVTRHYGGIKLGIGGLVRAYGGAASRCLDRAAPVERIDWVACELVGNFEFANRAHQLLAQHKARKIGERFRENGFALDLEIPRAQIETLKQEIAESSRGQATLWINR